MLFVPGGGFFFGGPGLRGGAGVPPPPPPHGRDLLTLERVTEIFVHDLERRGRNTARPNDPATDPQWVRQLSDEYPLSALTAP